MRRHLLLPLGLAAFAAVPAHADEAYDACMERAQTNAAFANCGTRMLARRELELNRVWKAAVAGLEASARSALLAEQRLWIAYKDESCAWWRSGAFGREGQTMHFYTCREGVIGQRIEYLHALERAGTPEG